MATNTRFIKAPVQAVVDVLADGWLYPSWVVGASRVRNVDETFPAVGSKIHHSFGVWPIVINDKTIVLEWDPPARVVLQARGWPVGEARVVLEFRARKGGCVVRIKEDAVTGPGKLVPSPIRNIGLYIRNIETLRRLAWIAEGRQQNSEP
jgi:hypothetical protein